MGLNVPELDDQRYEELREAALQRLPARAPEWTDHNAHDPGITIIELLAWLIESHSYQLDQVTDEHHRAYLRLLGTSLRPPRPATARVAIAPDTDPAPVVPAGTTVEVEPPDREVRTFQTDEDLTLTSAPIVALVTEDAEGRTDRTDANDRPNRTFAAFGPDATVGNALYLGFDGDPFGPHTQLDLLIDHANPMGTAADAETFEPSIEVQWQYLTKPDAWFDEDGWTDLDTRVDETNAWYRGGRVSLPQPLFWEAEDEAEAILGRDEPLVWLRAVARDRMSTNTGAGRLRYERPPELHAIRTNVVTASHRTRVEEVSLERVDPPGSERPPQSAEETSGRPHQQFTFPRSPVLDGQIRVGDDHWDRVETFAASGATDRHYRLDHDIGTITFGDGRQGAIPPPGEPVTATDVVFGGGPRGNVPDDSNWTISTGETRLGVTPLDAPRGGALSEPIPEAFERVRGELETAHRAVTARDYASLARRTPGVSIARAAVIEDGNPELTTVVIIPDGPIERRPMPTPGLRSTVERHLQERALLTDRVTVVAPTYVPVSVSATVRVEEGTTASMARDAIQSAIAEFLDPLAGYDGNGWPFDRPLHRSDLFEVLETVPEVSDAIDVTVDGGAATRLRDDPTSIPDLTNVSVTVDPDAEPCMSDRP